MHWGLKGRRKLSKLYELILQGIKKDFGSNPDVLKDVARGYFDLSNHIMKSLVSGILLFPVGLFIVGIYNDGINATLVKVINIFTLFGPSLSLILTAFSIFISLPFIASVYFQFRATACYDMMSKKKHQPLSKKLCSK